MINSRITQIESLLIDSEIRKIFIDQIQALFKTNIPEIELLFDFLYYRERIAKNLPLPGQELQNIEFCTKLGNRLSQKEKALYLLLVVFGKYVYNRLLIYFDKKNQKLYKILKKIELLFKLLKIAHLLRFIAQGQIVYSLELFIIGFSIKQIKENNTRELDFELLNRTLIWGIINKIFQSLLSSSNYLLNNLKKLFFMTSFLGTLQSEQSNDQCFVCNATIKTMKTIIEPCNHSFCYYCSQSKGNKCPQCNQTIEQIKQ